MAITMRIDTNRRRRLSYDSQFLSDFVMFSRSHDRVEDKIQCKVHRQYSSAAGKRVPLILKRVSSSECLVVVQV